MADLTVAKLRLPADLIGRTVNLIDFPTDKDCRAYYPSRSLEQHKEHNRLVRLQVLQRRGRVSYTVVVAALHDGHATQDERTRKAEMNVFLNPLRTH